MKEEFDTVVRPDTLLGDVVQTYTDRMIHLFFYSAYIEEGSLIPLEHQDTMWADIRTLLHENLLAEGDLIFVRKFLAES